MNKDTLAEGRSPSNSIAERENSEKKANNLRGNGTGKKASNAVQVKEGSNGLVGGSPALTEDPLTNRSIGGKKPKASGEDGSPLLELSGYNPKRQEFDPEYDNDAELPLAEMEFKDNDSETDHELKLRMLRIYLSRLGERKRRKDFILERDLLHSRPLDKMLSKEEKELYQRCRVFMRFHSQEEHNALLDGLNMERKLRQRIQELQEYRAAGCHTLAEGEQYAAEKKKREAEASQKKSKESCQLAASGKVAQRANRTTNRERGEGDGSPGGMVDNQKIKSTAGQAPVGNNTCPAATGQKGAKKSLIQWDIMAFPGVELLSDTERELCTQNRLLPAHYLKMKEVLMLESLQGSSVKRSDAYRFFKVDQAKVDKVYDLLSRMGWIQGEE